MVLTSRLVTGIALSPIVLACLSSCPAFAQLESDPAGNPRYYITGDYALSSPLVPDYDIFVGRIATYPNGPGGAPVFQDLPGTITFTARNGASIAGTPISPLRGVSVYGNHRADLAGGELINSLYYFQNSTGIVSSGTVDGGLNFHDNSHVRVTGGTVAGAVVWDTASVAVSGGTLHSLQTLGNAHATVSGGTIANIMSSGNSSVTFTGGSLPNGNSVLSVLEQSQATVSGGFINQVSAVGQGTVRVSNGTIGTITNENASNMVVTGGTIGYAFNNSNSVGSLTVYGGTVNNSAISGAFTVNAYGGSFYDLVAFDNSNIRLWDGDMTAPGSTGAYGGYGSGFFDMTTEATYTFYGQGLTFSNPQFGNAFFQSWTGIYYDVSWTQWDGTVINSRFFDKDGSLSNATPRGVNFVFTNTAPPALAPEPDSIALLGVAVLPLIGTICRRKT